MRSSLLPTIRDFVQKGISPTDMERLALEILRHDNMENVTWTAGPWECGADGICEVPLAYNLRIKLAIQVKQHRVVSYDQTGLDQLEDAFKSHGAQAGILVNTAETLGPDVRSRIDDMKKTRNIEVICGDDLYYTVLELLADNSHEFNL